VHRFAHFLFSFGTDENDGGGDVDSHLQRQHVPRRVAVRARKLGKWLISGATVGKVDGEE